MFETRIRYMLPSHLNYITPIHWNQIQPCFRETAHTTNTKFPMTKLGRQPKWPSCINISSHIGSNGVGPVHSLVVLKKCDTGYQIHCGCSWTQVASHCCCCCSQPRTQQGALCFCCRVAHWCCWCWLLQARKRDKRGDDPLIHRCCDCAIPLLGRSWTVCWSCYAALSCSPLWGQPCSLAHSQPKRWLLRCFEDGLWKWHYKGVRSLPCSWESPSGQRVQRRICVNQQWCKAVTRATDK